MREIIILLAIMACTCVIGSIWYDKGYDDAIKNINDNYPSAMDVYQGKTTLQYTIVDGEKVDSVVVFKK